MLDLLSHRINRGALMATKFERYLVGPLSTLAFIALVQLATHFEWYTASLAFPFIGLAIGAFYGGLRSNLVSALFITLYTVIASDYNIARSIQIILAALTIAVISGALKQSLRRSILEAEYYRQKAIDTYNGNRSKMVEALDNLDRALRTDDIVDVKKFVQIARIKQADTLTLTGSWHEMAKDKRIAVEEIEKAGGYPYRADELVRETNLLVREVLSELYRLRRIVEGPVDEVS